MTMDYQRRRIYLVGVSFMLVALVFYLRSGPRETAPLTSNSLPYGLRPANSTLGFEAILAVSRKGSHRREDLTFAANLTGLDITIPDQPKWTDEDVASLHAERGSKITRGSALAWLGHLNALQWFLDSGLSTALILEDDVDWDVHLRTVQIPLAARAFRDLVGGAAAKAGYWGDAHGAGAGASWEILYLGHCGDFMAPERFDALAKVRFDDDTLPRRDRMHTKTSGFLDQLGLPPGQRVLHRSHWPLCTFGYAVTRASARRIATDFAAKETEDGGCEAFDVRILEACRDFDWLCYSVNPELFHHIEAPSEIAEINSGIDDQGRLKRQSLQGTPNVACGARSRNFFTRDPKTLAYLQDVVGEKGHCLMDQMEEDMSRWP